MLMQRKFTVRTTEDKSVKHYLAWQNGRRDNIDSIMDRLAKDFPLHECYVVTSDEHGFILRKSTHPFDVYWQQNILGHLGFDLSDD